MSAVSRAVREPGLKTYGIMLTLTLPEITAVRCGLANYGSAYLQAGFFTTTPENIGWQK